jgi:ATP-dependent protease HslVU (ClpYQ) peptidase subunit
MTTLIAVQHEDWCIIAGDSQTTSYHLSADCSPMGKIAQNGKYLVAAAGLVRGMNLIQHAFIPPKPVKSNLDKFMVTKFLPALRRSFITSGYDMKDDGDVAQHDNEFLVAVNGTVYLIDEAYGIERTSNKIYVTGSGMELALGAADALGLQQEDDWQIAIEIVERAVRTAMKYDIYSGGSVQVALQDRSGQTWITYLDPEGDE